MPTTTKNSNLTAARRAKNDEFYTQWNDIEKEVMAYVGYDPDVFRGKTILLPCDDPEWSNFTKFFALRFDTLGLRKLIATSYNKDGGHGRVAILTHDITGDGRTNLDDLEWEHLTGDGDFRSPEVTALRDRADIIITNPPFSLFREFLPWITEADKQFLIIGNINAITYKEIFPLIKNNEIWTGVTGFNQDMLFTTPGPVDTASLPDSAYRIVEGIAYRRAAAIWFTNIDHGRRHEPLALMNTADNLRCNPALTGKTAYDRYDNYDAIEVPKTKAIPSDHRGIMGVPISFLDKYCPEQFEIIGLDSTDPDEWVGHGPLLNGRAKYRRIFIKYRNTAR